MRLDGGIALNGETLGLIIVVVDPQVMRTGFSCYLFVFLRNIISKQRQFLFGGDVHDMQPCAEFLSHVDSFRR